MIGFHYTLKVHLLVPETVVSKDMLSWRCRTSSSPISTLLLHLSWILVVRYNLVSWPYFAIFPLVLPQSMAPLYLLSM
jgi:hypothetical protein